jgi:hypothetical protein
MNKALRIGAAFGISGDFPDFSHIFKGKHKGFALWGLINGGHTAGGAVGACHIDHLLHAEVIG